MSIIKGCIFFLIILQSCSSPNNEGGRGNRDDSSKKSSPDYDNQSSYSSHYNDETESIDDTAELKAVLIDSFKIKDYLDYEQSLESKRYKAKLNTFKGPEIYRVRNDSLLILNPLSEGNILEIFSLKGSNYLGSQNWHNDIGSSFGSPIYLHPNTELTTKNKAFLTPKQMPYYYLKKNGFVSNFKAIDSSLIGFYSDPYKGNYFFIYGTYGEDSTSNGSYIDTILGFYSKNGTVDVLDTISLNVSLEGVDVYFRTWNNKVVIYNSFKSDSYVFYYDLKREKWENVLLEGYPLRFIGLTEENNLLSFNEENCSIKLSNSKGAKRLGKYDSVCELDKDYLSFYYNSSDKILYSAFFDKSNLFVKIYKTDMTPLLN